MDLISYHDDEIGVIFDNEQKRIFKTTPNIALKIKNNEEYANLFAESYMNKKTDKLSKCEYTIQIILTTACNLKCRYCYANGGNYGLSIQNISFGILDRLIEYINLNDINKIEFFGGEPLIAFDEMKYILSKLKNNKNIHYAIVTNLTCLTEEMVSIFKDYPISITVSLDGPEIVNDKNRYFKNGMGTFKTVCNNINLLMENDICVNLIECTYGIYHQKYNISRSAIKEYFRNLFPNTCVLICNEENENCIADYNVIEEDCEFFWFEKRKSNICGAGRTAFTVCPNGDIYPCQKFVGKRQYFMGNILNYNSINQTNILKDVDNLEQQLNCKECTARNGCARCLDELLKMPANKLCQMCENIRAINEKQIINYIKDTF
ncbi:MAG: radical SAM protein [Methanobrevibacter sp.]|uniref:radical SAM/SPASM domain-containing protein n=1 Tax=Methanobrevibacter sp. TaxID=66852 RepID=UPI001B60C8F9|nr:radical SAM protein [Methanobrevibacter sp.]MBP3790540.1 radical SAM protein [Methanobrevibacter sp.]